MRNDPTGMLNRLFVTFSSEIIAFMSPSSTIKIFNDQDIGVGKLFVCIIDFFLIKGFVIQMACLKGMFLLQCFMLASSTKMDQNQNKKFKQNVFFNFIYGYIYSYENGNYEQNDKNEIT